MFMQIVTYYRSYTLSINNIKSYFPNFQSFEISEGIKDAN